MGVCTPSPVPLALELQPTATQHPTMSNASMGYQRLQANHVVRIFMCISNVKHPWELTGYQLQCTSYIFSNNISNYVMYGDKCLAMVITAAWLPSSKLCKYYVPFMFLPLHCVGPPPMIRCRSTRPLTAAIPFLAIVVRVYAYSSYCIYCHAV
jgi:hypothetical protein